MRVVFMLLFLQAFSAFGAGVAPKSTYNEEGNSIEVSQAADLHGAAMLPQARDEELGSRWCTNPTASTTQTSEQALSGGTAAGGGMKSATKLAALGVGLGLGAAGCGSGTVIVAMVSPTISQVSPQVVTAGTPSVTVTVQGSNFQSNASVSVNGSAMPTTMVNSTTLAAKIDGSTLAQPAVKHLQVKNSDGATSNEVPLTVTSPSQPSSLAISTAGLPGAQSGTAYSAAMSASGGTPGYNWSITSGSLPAGLTLSAGGAILGTPTASGTSTFGVTVSDSGSPVQSQTVTLSIVVLPVTTAPPALGITSGALGSAQVGSGYNATLSATGGTPGFTWSLASGTLPAGLALSSAGTISGTPTTSGTSTFTVAVKDSGSPAQSVSSQVSITVVPPGLAVRSLSLGSGLVGSSYTTTLSASGGTPGYTWSLASGSLPAGLTLSSAGVISGTPTATGTATFTVAVADSASPALTASAQESLTISVSGLSITSTSLAAGQNGSSYSTTLSATGGTPGYTWSLASGSLPAGLTLSKAGKISGNPTATGTSTFTVAVNDSGSPAQTASAQESLTISASGLSITSTSLAAGKDGTSYTTTLSATGGTPGYTWSIASGSLPAGLTLSKAGKISGTPTATGTATFTLAVSDSGSPVQTASVQESLTIAASGLAITSTSLSAGKTGTSYSATLTANGGTPGYTWSLASGSLPAGLTMSSSGVISGTPTASGNANFTVSVTDSSSPTQTASLSESITVSSSQLAITTTSLAGGQATTAYTASLSASGGTPSYTWTISAGSLPAGLALSSSGVISGTPTAAGTSNFTVAVSDNSSPVQSTSLALSINVGAQSASTGTTWYIRPDGGTRYSSTSTAGQCDGQGDQSYAAAVAANGGTAAPNLHCAFNSPQYLWQDGTASGYHAYGWIIAGGDTVIIRGSIADGVSYRIGWPNANSYCDSSGSPCFGYPAAGGGGPYSGPPAGFPSGTPGHPTRILGGNYGACSAQSARTQLHGGYGMTSVLDFSGAAYLDVECLDITDFSSCGYAGQATPCNKTTMPYDDFAMYGLRLSNSINNSTFTDIRIHGLGVEGMVGPVGDNVTFTDLALIGNAGGGWNADDGTVGSGNMLVQNFDISWNGCAEEYPLVDALPYDQCTDDQSYTHGGSNNGYGDGFGTATVTGTVAWHVKFENGIVSYNTQDGIDALHATGAGSTTTADRILAYGNMGNQIKIGSDGGSTITNNVIFGNCSAMSTAIPGTPSSYNSMLSDFCRADDEAIIISMNNGSTSTVAGNTIYGFREGNPIENWGDLGGIICTAYLQGGTQCGSTASIVYVDNILVGFDPLASGTMPSQYYLEDGAFVSNPLQNPRSVYRNNLHYQLSTPCADTGETSAICAAPQVNNVSWPVYGYVDVQPTAGSSNVVGAGIAIPAVTQDYTGINRGTPPSIGAYE